MAKLASEEEKGLMHNGLMCISSAVYELAREAVIKTLGKKSLKLSKQDFERALASFEKNNPHSNVVYAGKKRKGLTFFLFIEEIDGKMLTVSLAPSLYGKQSERTAFLKELAQAKNIPITTEAGSWRMQIMLANAPVCVGKKDGREYFITLEESMAVILTAA